MSGLGHHLGSIFVRTPSYADRDGALAILLPAVYASQVSNDEIILE